MKLATLKDSTRDGKLVVVSKDLTRCSEVGHIARTLQAALDDWAHVAPRLQRVAIGLETGSQPTMRFHEHDAASPLPRAFSWTGGTGFFDGPRDAVSVVSNAPLTSSVQAAVIVDDTEAGSQVGGIVLVMLAHSVLEDGAPVASTFSPVAVTPDEIEGWDKGNAVLPLIVSRNGTAEKTTETIDFNAAVTAAVGGRALGAGSVVAADTEVASVVAVGDVVRVEMNDRTGHSIFGAIEQTMQAR
ncbi:2-keto-4-pentenoate hydratase [Rhizobium sp. 32-5/1]|uniref:2-keto-4-pentenoate hydratase n=1 Tax=Rhizobium sp. 32-5/1 TaxID=3019602 RepID=UPI00240E35C7|nr:2-keto-4-pentenoate hydratase [Rhizobium sp. 32-5/1]WEZ83093.1 2-keto-4-pentenoate hydratase [Rhizobium sp. 32-5/1]